MRDTDGGGTTGSPLHARAFLARLLRGGHRRAGDKRPHGFLRRLARDTRGNTLAIIGAALVPLAGMIGSGVDMSRAYMAKTRLQSACDAAALAGRRVMQNDTLDTTVTNEAVRFFNFNFPQRLYNTATFTPAVTRPSTGTVRVTASTTIPTSIMKIFGFTTLPLSVTCDASLNFVNTDVMLVLDTTGSMDNDVNDLPTTNDSARKITALRDAVMALYDQLAPTQAQLQAAGMRLRYGVVPYSSSVNVGALIRAANASYLSDSVSYQSRVANYTTLNSNSSANGPYWEYYTATAPYYTQVMANSTSITQANCLSFMNNQNFTGFTATPTNPTSGGPPPATTLVASFPSDGVATAGGSTGEWGYTGAPVTSGTNRSCRRHRTDTTTTYNYAYTNDSFVQSSYDTSQFKLGNPVTIANPANNGLTTDYNGSVPTSGAYDLQDLAIAGTGVTTTSSTWNGCIEERDTVNTITATSGYTIPSGAYDLNVNLIPNSPQTRWRPMWPAVVYRRTAGASSATSGTSMGAQNSANWACPAPAVRLTAWTRATMQNYVNTLAPLGGTYHDIGMIWGARMLSSGGIFADSPDTFGGMPVSRHIIFMTDGQLAPNCNSYTAYGVEQNDMRVTGAGTCPNQYDRHLQRFKMVCNAAKSMNISIWVIAFGTTLSTDMQQCASNSNQASTAADRNALIARFQQIGSQIGALRLTQ
jgi:Flp pilus assembly protein TadG